jgi:hypothetical protein
VWWQEQGLIVLLPFPADTEYFGRPEQAWKLNLRVRDLDAMVARLRAADIDVIPDPQTYPNGRFASTADPEGNPIELWEPTPYALQEPPDPAPPTHGRPKPTDTARSVGWCSASTA